MIRVNRQIKCPNNLFFVLWNLMIYWIVFILHREIFPIHHTYIYSLVSYLFIKQDQTILTCNSAVESLMLSRFLFLFQVLYILLLLHKLRHFKTNSKANRWIHSFIENRKRMVRLEGTLLTLVTVLHGVHQLQDTVSDLHQRHNRNSKFIGDKIIAGDSLIHLNQDDSNLLERYLTSLED